MRKFIDWVRQKEQNLEESKKHKKKKKCSKCKLVFDMEGEPVDVCPQCGEVL